MSRSPVTIDCKTLAAIEQVIRRAGFCESCDQVSIKIESSQTTLLNKVLRCRVSTGDATTPAFYVYAKVEKTADATSPLEHEIKSIESVGSFLTPCITQYNCVNAIGYCDDNRLLVLRECTGDRLLDLIDQNCRWGRRMGGGVLSAGRAAGGWVGSLESHSKGMASNETVASDVHAMTAVAYERVCDMNSLPRAKQLAERCMFGLDGALSDIGRLPPSTYLAHGDFHPGNLFVSNAEPCVTAIDFQLSRPQFVGFDMLYFHMTCCLSFGPRRYRPWTIRRLYSAFQEGHDAAGIPDALCRRLVKSQIVMRSLVYLSTIASQADGLRAWACSRDFRKVQKWYDSEW